MTAIVGIGCRFPGGVSTPGEFWELLATGRDAITEIPSSRFDVDALYDAEPARPGKISTRWGGFVGDLDAFDAAFFGISPREARRIDPQQRLLLEVVWEALEDGGQPPDRLAASATGVFVGVSGHDYADLQTAHPNGREQIDLYVNPGSAASIAANRVSYLLDLRGPSLAVDTACSSALTAVHLACASLGRGECDIAIAAAANALITPEPTIGFSQAGMLSPRGRCRPFDASADGYVRSEGAAAIVLKPLRRAVEDGDPIYAVILGSGINQDGHTAGLSVPNPFAQQALMEAVLRNADLKPADVQYVEAHGTGTPVGDPREARAIGGAMARRAADVHCVIGSAKGNVGHLESAAGMVGLVKAALALQRRLIPPTINFEEPNPSIPFDDLRLRVATSLEDWPPCPNGRAVAGVNSFGFGGANAHILLGEPPRPPAARESDHQPDMLTLSARSPAALHELARRWARLLADDDGQALGDLCATAAVRRSHHEHRLAAVAGSRVEFAVQLEAFADGTLRAGVMSGRRPESGPPKLAFAFAGMGPQRHGMGQELLRTEPVFAAAVAECDRLLRPLAGWSVGDELTAPEEESRLGEPQVAHVATFVLQVALAALWRSWGIVPDAVVGHSSGEMAAAHVAGSLDLACALRLAFHRGRLLQRLVGTGGMLAAGVSVADSAEVLRRFEGRVSVAAINGPASLTLSGERSALAEIAASLEERGCFNRMLAVSVPYHSPQVDSLHSEFLASVADIRSQLATIPFASTVNGEWQDGQPLDAGYWWANVRQPVLFAGAMDELIATGCELFVEVSPHPVLRRSISEALAAHGRTGAVLPTLRRDEGERAAMLQTLGALHVNGRAVDWRAFFPGERRCVPLPTYPWQRERHWLEAPPETHSGHPLLGRRRDGPRPGWDSDLSDLRLAYLDGHLVQDRVTIPAAAYLEVALAAARAVRGGPVAVEDVEFRRLMAVRDRRDHRLGCVAADSDTVEVHSAARAEPTGWTLRATARVAHGGARPAEFVDLAAARDRCPTAVDVNALYDTLADQHGLRYVGAFRSVAELWTGDGEALGHVVLPEGQGGPLDGYQVHPALLDAAFHVAAAAGAIASAESGTYVPVAVDRYEVWAPPGPRFWCRATVTGRGDLRRATVELFADGGHVAVRCDGISLRRLDPQRRPEVGDWLYEETWAPSPRAAPGTTIAAAEVATMAQPLLDERAIRLSMPAYYQAAEPALNAMTATYVDDAMAELGYDPTRDAHRSPDDMAADLGVSPQHHRLFARLLQLARTHPHSPDNHRVEDPDHWSAAELVRLSGTRLAATLRGDVDAREWMVAGEASSVLAELYHRSPGFVLYTEAIADAVATIQAASPSRTLRILEVGGGTGSATAPVLDRLPGGPVDFVFTDISPYFVKAARQRFGSRPGFSAQVLDIEAPFSDAAPFDVVIASDVVHATADIRQTLGNLRGLLAPNGSLVLMEVTRRAPWLDLVFGQFDGWWRFNDHHLRPDHALLGLTQWREAIEEAGFTCAPVADRPPVEPCDPLQAVFVATAPAGLPPTRTSRRWLVLTDRQGVGPEVAAGLRERGDCCVLAWPGPAYRRYGNDGIELPPSSAPDWERLLHDVGVVDGIVHLWALDAPDPNSGAGLVGFQETSCGSVVALTAALTTSERALPELWLVTAGVQAELGDGGGVGQAPLWGLGRVLRTEQGSARCRLVDLGAACSAGDVQALLDELDGADVRPSDELALRSGQRFVRRLRRATLPEPPADSEPDVSPDRSAYRLGVQRPGDLGSLALRRTPDARPGPGQVSIRIRAGALNFRDVLAALGTAFATAGEDPAEAALGWECAGVVLAVGEGVDHVQVGDEVVAVAAGALASQVVTRAELVVPKPSRLSFEEAATVPVAFLTAHYALERLGRLAAGERVLIHSAAGGVGLAAVQLAHRMGADVFATAGTPEKRAYLESLGVEQVMDSRSLDFADEVLRRTGGEGVDVVLNSLAGEAAANGLAVLRPQGRFIEIGKRDIYEGGRLDLAPFRRNLSYVALDLHPLYEDQPALVGSLLRTHIAAVDRGELQPLPHHDFDLSDAADAFRLMARAQHTGKVVLTVREPGYRVVRAGPAQLFRSDATYLITGGLGGFSLAVARWMVREGARHLVLMSRSGAPHTGDAAALEELLAAPADVAVLRADVAERDDVRRVLDQVRATMPPLRGVIHAAMVLDDGLLGRLDYARFEAALRPKLAGAANLDEHTAGDDLDLFVLFSSISAVIGQPAQSGYAAGNAFLDALAHARRARGQPALVVAWGAIADAGYVARSADLPARLQRQGLEGMASADACDVLGELLRRGVGSMVVSAGAWGAGGAAAHDNPRPGTEVSVFEPSERPTRRMRVLDVPPDERGAALGRYLLDVTARVLELAPARIDPDRALFQLGLDSLMAVELRTAVRAELDVEIPIVDLLEELSLRRVAAVVLRSLEDADAARR